MQWTELSINTTDEAVDWVYMLLIDADYTGDIGITPYNATDENSSPWTFTIRLYLDNKIHINQQIDKIAQLLTPLQRTGMASELEIAVVESKPITNTNVFRHRIGNRFLILPANVTNETTSPDDIIIKLKPSLAFGSGLHPATILSLKLIEKYVTPGTDALDLGCGSGILSIAIAKLGASVLGLDNDAIAVQSTQSAVHLNGVEQQVTVMAGSLGNGSTLGHWMGGETTEKVQAIDNQQKFDLIVANIFARIHIALAKDYQQALDENGILIAAGFTNDYEESITTTMTEHGFTVIDRERLNEWVGIALRVSK
ncbi:50S ribosomal protein L11 methyltransferase [Calothrix rhizosoleniae]|uniref:50S ribosomal protein L11 methyltransferase n=1 Tax=Calothrix rhizosoleniae TaxID=888997 RepID=UPI000B4970C9|nr:50S ribosomal protein L11 methyltransferase [Calothrix rhizosoleniae]